MVPLNTRLTHHEADYQLDRTEARALFWTGGQAEKVAALEARRDLVHVFVGERAPSGTRSYDQVLQDARNTPLPVPDSAHPSMIAFTSGSTGRPKGAVLTHRSTITMATTQLIALRIPIGGVNIQAISMSFPATIVGSLMSHLLAGGTQVLAAVGSWDDERLLEIIQQERGTHVFLPAPVLPGFTEAARQSPKRWQSLVSVLHSGSRADPEVLEALANVIGTRYLEGYGMTELSGGLACATTPDDLRQRAEGFFRSTGRPVPGAVVKLVDDDGRRLPHDGEAVGELTLSCRSLFEGYWQDPEATAQAIVDGWYHTGDLGSIGPDGTVYISDRTKNLIRSGGMNVYPAEIELVLERCPGIVECAVVGAPHKRWGETPVAVVVREPGAELNEQAVIDFAVEHLAGYKKPTRVVFADALPRTTSGKVMKAAVRELVDAERPTFD